MKKVICVILTVFLLLCCSCTQESVVPSGFTDNTESPITDTSESITESVFVPAPTTVTAQTPTQKATEKEDLSNMPIDPAYDFDVDQMKASDFGELFTESFECSVSSYKLLSGTDFENEVTVIQSTNDGPAVYVVAGVHGDEEAAWQAGKLLKKISIKSGTLYIIAPANKWGASKVPKSRYVDGKDLNRSFPGNDKGTAAQKVANAIFQDIKSKNPSFVFDLHEARIVEEGRDYLGSSLIFTDVTLFDELFFNLLWATEDGEICSRPFNYYAPGPDGSINQTVTTQLSIPTLTVETFRGYPMENRISDQLDVVQYVLRYYGMY